MATVNKEIADKIVAGEYPEYRAVKIVKYQNAFDGGDSYGVIFKGENLFKYSPSQYVINPVVYWREE